MEEVSQYHQKDEQLREEEELIRRAKKDPEKFRPLYDKYYLQIHKYLFKRLGSDEETRELTSIVFAKALHNLNDYEFRGLPLSAWLYRIAYNEIALLHRNKKKQSNLRADKEELKVALNLCGKTEREEFSRDDLERLGEALGKLKDEDRELIQLRYFEDRPFKEIGQITENTENNARVKTHRALQKLKKYFKK